MNIILIINICRERFHYFEFVRPIEEILTKNKIDYITRHYMEINEKDLEKAEKIIICGTSLKDNEFLEDIDKFSWIKSIDKPILGICGGMQVIGMVFGGKLNKKTEIGYFKENFIDDFLGLKGEQEVYHLHNNYVEFGQEFEKFTDSKINQAVKYNEKNIYGVLFHPEVRQKKLISNFCLNN